MPNIHPVLVHFPIALLSLSFLCEGAALLWNREDLSSVGWWTQLTGSIGLAAAAVSGMLAGDSAGIPPAANPYLGTHKQIAFAAASAFAVLFFWRIASGTRRPPGATGCSSSSLPRASLRSGRAHGTAERWSTGSAPACNRLPSPERRIPKK